jgi:hypothetical protein
MNHGDQCPQEQERLKQIAEILCTAILANGPFSEEPGGSVAEEGDQGRLLVPVPAQQGNVPEDKVVNYLSKVGEASPAILRAVLQLPRTSAYRVIDGLVGSGRIVSEGQTRALVYRLGPLPPHRQNVEGN